MKKIIPILLLAGSLMLSGCGDSGDDVNVISGAPVNPGPVIPNPPVPPPQPTSGIFVDSVNGNDASGNAATGSPFQTIQAAVTAAGANTTIVVRPGNYTGAVNLVNGQRLLGAGSTLVNAQGTTRPVLTGPVVLADGNTLDFLRIAGTAGDAIDGDDQNGGTVTNCEIASTTNFGSGFDAVSATGIWQISNNSISNVTGSGILFSTTAGDALRARINNNAITNSAFNAIGFVSEDNSTLTAQVNDNRLTGNQAGFTFESIAFNTSISTFEIRRNQNSDTFLFDSADNSTIRVEDFANLSTLNTGTVTLGLLSKPIVSVPAGTTGL